MSTYFGDDRYAASHIVYSNDFKDLYGTVKNGIKSGSISPEYYPKLFPGWDKEFEAFDDMTPDERMSCTSGKAIAEETHNRLLEGYIETVQELDVEAPGQIIGFVLDPGGKTRVMDCVGMTIDECLKSVNSGRQMQFAVTELDEFTGVVKGKDDPDEVSVYTFRALKGDITSNAMREIEQALAAARGDMGNVQLSVLLDRYTECLGPTVRKLKEWEEPERAMEFNQEKAVAASRAIEEESAAFETFYEKAKTGQPFAMTDGITYCGYLASEEFRGYMLDLSAALPGQKQSAFGFLDLRTGIIYAEPIDLGGKSPLTSLTGKNGFHVERYSAVHDNIMFRVSEAVIQAGLDVLAEEGITLERGWHREEAELPYFETAANAFSRNGGRTDIAVRQTEMFKNEAFMKRLDARNGVSVTKRYLINPQGFLKAVREGAVVMDRETLKKDGLFRLADQNTLKELALEMDVPSHGKTRGRG